MFSIRSALKWFLIAGLVSISVAGGLKWIPIKTHYGYLDNHSGSTKQWTEWLYLVKTNYKYSENHLEPAFRNHPSIQFYQNWQLYKGTAKNIYGETLMLQSGGATTCLMMFPAEKFVEESSDTDLAQFYDLLETGSQKSISNRVHDISERIYNIR